MLTRRGWIAAAGAARLAGANGRIGVGVIGVGGRGRYLTTTFKDANAEDAIQAGSRYNSMGIGGVARRVSTRCVRTSWMP